MSCKLLQMGGVVALPFAVGLALSGSPAVPAGLTGSGTQPVTGSLTAVPYGHPSTLSAGLPAAGDGSAGIIRYPEDLPGPLTGGFGEESCHSCHFDYDLNQPDGSLTVEGLDESWRPGQRYEVTLTLARESLGRGGFQMTARFEDGRQAGEFESLDNRVTFTPGIPEEIQYLQHSENGIEPGAENQAMWKFVWVAPEETDAPVLFHVAANAANGDRSEFGDWIYLNKITLRPHE